MSDFVVSARKYRPQTFDTVVGQKSITGTLKKAIKKEHLAQAFLFCGSRGVGKTTTARILAKTINCTQRSENTEACDKCDSCESFNSGASLNVYELDAASNNSVEDIRGLIDQVRIAPQLGDFKVYIIDEVHMLSTNAFNAFLKTLEEPPKHAIFILATTEKHKIIPTILSRCQIFDFSRITVKDITDHLAEISKKEKVKAEIEALHLIAMKADGALRDALSVFDQMVTFSGNELTYNQVIENLHILDYDYFFKFVDFTEKEDIPGSLLLFNEILEKGFDAHNFLSGLSSHYRNLLVCKDDRSTALLEVPEQTQKRYVEQSKGIPHQTITRALYALSKADNNYKSSKNPRLLVEVALMELCSLKQEQEKKKALTDRIDFLPFPEKSLRKEKNKSTPKQEQKSVNIASVKTVDVKIDTPKKITENQPLPIPKIVKKSESRLSIKDMLKREEELKNKPTDENLPEEKYTADRLVRVWRQYAFQVKDEGQETFYNALVKRDPLIEKNDVLKLFVENQIQVDYIKPLLNKLISFIRKSLQNYNITIEIELTENPVEDIKLMHGKDKFKAMAKKNPNLNTLKNLFNLDIEF